MSETISILSVVRDPIGSDPNAPTMGVMTALGLPAELQTLEPPWRGNQPQVSCVPEGEYELKFHSSERFHGALLPLLLDVPDRSDILIHVGNYLVDTHGCILPGMSRSPDGRELRRSGLALGLVVDWVRRALAGGRAFIRISRAEADRPVAH